MKTCSTCNMTVREDFVEFKCPKCGKAQIVRCQKCREMVKGYKCTECGFKGP